MVEKRDEIALRKPWLAAWGGEVSRVEPSLGSDPGIPDVWLSQWGMTGWVEFKVADEGGWFTLEPSQHLWLAKNLLHCSNVAYCVMDRDGFWLFNAINVSSPVLRFNVHRISRTTHLTWKQLEAVDHQALLNIVCLAWET